MTQRTEEGTDYSPATMAACRAVARVWLPALHFYRATGLEHLPAEGPVILAANHTSYFDPILITYPMPRRLYYLAWHRLFANPLFANVIRRLGAIPVDTDRRADRGAYQGALRLLHAGHAICIFPEGIRGWDGGVYPLQGGVARLALATGAPIIPVAVQGAFAAWPRWQLLPCPFVPIRVRFMPAIRPPAVTHSERRRAADELLKELADALREGIR